MIKSILDTDLYKFTTSYAYMKLFPYAEGKFTFIDRDNTIYDEEFKQELIMEIYKLGRLKLTFQEQIFMNINCRFIPPVYWEWLSSFKFNPDNVNVYFDDENHLHIEVTDLMYKVTLYEVPLLAIVSELRNKLNPNVIVDLDLVRSKTLEKVEMSNRNEVYFSEFGTRRRYNYNVQDLVLNYLKSNALYCTGTSNPHFAMKYGMKMMGTHPHEWFMFHAAIYGPKQANYLALENWAEVYDGDLGIALSDTYTTDVFMSDISRKLAKLFDGVRHDSGDPYKFVSKVINRYKELGIDPTSKTIIFSNALTFPEAVELNEYCRGRIKRAFGIGTNLTNDINFIFGDYKPANIVMKLNETRINSNKKFEPCVKLSDDEGKITGNLEVAKRYKEELGICG